MDHLLKITRETGLPIRVEVRANVRVRVRVRSLKV